MTEPTSNAEKGAIGYRRDRSFYASRPSWTGATKVHRAALDYPGMAACDTRRILLNTDMWVLLNSTPVGSLCRRCYPNPPGAQVRP